MRECDEVNGEREFVMEEIKIRAEDVDLINHEIGLHDDSILAVDDDLQHSKSLLDSWKQKRDLIKAKSEYDTNPNKTHNNINHTISSTNSTFNPSRDKSVVPNNMYSSIEDEG